MQVVEDLQILLQQFPSHLYVTYYIVYPIYRALLNEGCDSPYLLGFLVELLQWRLEGEQDGAQVVIES